ncbi:outer membrane protein, cobalt-zinc-cadmium efflux system [Nitrosospira briensis]|uniref:Outer membrane protein, cobalt-zinc-cadmium efflux system n=2 Tax=Nitrosospira briensis TaxID=35799 RepID=A0A1I4XSH0_9PROT|nr:outer membrane protein, cobalt-zinc-cadmium efflux system [Nitrosospira briensis]
MPAPTAPGPTVPGSVHGKQPGQLPPAAARPTMPTPTEALPSEVLTVHELQRLGLKANGLVQAAHFQVRAAEAGVVGASAYPNPQLTFMAGPQHARIPQALPSNSHRQFTISQPIENPFLRSARIGSAEAGVDASHASLEQVRADLAAQLRVAAYELVLRQEVARVEASVSELMEEIRRRVKVRVDVGEAARFELIRAETEVLAAASRREAAQLNAQRARVALIQLTAGALRPDFHIEGSLTDPVDLPPLEELREIVPAVNPEVTRLQAEWNRASLRTKQERAAVLPSVTVLLSNFQEAQYTSNLAGVNVTIPLFYRRRGEIDAAVADSERARGILEFRRFEIGQLLESAWQAKQIAQRRVEMFEGGLLKEAESALEVAQAAYRFGERGLIEVLDTQRVLRGLLSDLLQARFDLQVAVAEIDRLRAHYPKEDLE